MKTLIQKGVACLSVLALMLIILIRLLDTDTLRDISLKFNWPLVIPAGELQSKHSDAEKRHNDENTKIKASDHKTFDAYKDSAKDLLKRVNYVNVDETELDQNKRVEWATPFEWKPGEKGGECHDSEAAGPINAALLIHGLTDTPFLMQDIGKYLNTEHCFLVRSILLPGHGTVPGDLLNVVAEEWIAASAYGINSFFNEKKAIKNLYVVGFSTGGTLALYSALYSEKLQKDSGKPLLNEGARNALKGLILLSPAVQVKVEGQAKFANWHKYIYTSGPKWFSHEHGEWLDIAADKDFAKYESFAKNAADQIHRLSNRVYCSENEYIWELPRTRAWPWFFNMFCDTEHLNKFTTPIFMAISKQDETVNADAAIEFFNDVRKKSKEEKVLNNSKLIIYSAEDQSQEEAETNKNITWINVRKDDNKVGESLILDLSHTAIPVDPCNHHYGNPKITDPEECQKGRKSGGTEPEPISNYYSCVHYYSGNKEEAVPEKYRECMGYIDDKNIVYGEKSSKKLKENCALNSNKEKDECIKESATLRRLTFNPYFKELTKEIGDFLKNTGI